MDRNLVASVLEAGGSWSLSARRAWIEIARPTKGTQGQYVALRKESVDRNDTVQIVIVVMHGRSPQGERG